MPFPVEFTEHCSPPYFFVKLVQNKGPMNAKLRLHKLERWQKSYALEDQDVLEC